MTEPSHPEGDAPGGSSPIDEAERSVLGSMLMHPEAVADVALLRFEDFASPQHQVIFGAVRAVHEARGVSDPISVADELLRRGRLLDVGGMGYLMDLFQGVVTAANIAYHAEIVRGAATRRRMTALAQRIAAVAPSGGDVAGLVADLVEVSRGSTSAPRSSPPTIVRSLGDVENLPPLRWLVDGLLPTNSILMLASVPNLGKTAIAVGMTMAAATGSPWCGRSVMPGGVVIVSGEGLAGIGQRSMAWRAWAGSTVQQHPVEVADRLPALSTPLGISELRRIIDEFKACHGARPVLAIVDTLAVHWAESENESEHVGPCLAALRAIADAGTSVLLLHHMRKPGPDRSGGTGDAWAAVRGSGAWVGGCDAVLTLSGTREALTLSTTRQREGACAAPMRLALRTVEIGTTDAPRSGVVVVAAVDQPSEVEVDPAADPIHEVMIRRVVEAMRALGGVAASKSSVYERMKGKTDAKKAAFAECQVRGIVLRSGSNASLRFHLHDPT